MDCDHMNGHGWANTDLLILRHSTAYIWLIEAKLFELPALTLQNSGSVQPSNGSTQADVV